MKLASFDIEISDDLSTPGDPGFPPHISCAAIALSEDPANVKYFSSADGADAMTTAQIHDMIANIYQMRDAGYTFLTWNGVSFDFQVVAALAENANVAADVLDIAWRNHIDMMLLVTFQTGYRLGLDAALNGAGLAGKLHNVALSTGEVITDMSGAKAPELWRAGERAAVLEYLREDVLQPLALAEYIERTKAISWISRKGRYMHVDAPKLLTVEEAFYRLPEPEDTSWLTDPILRRPYIEKYLPAAIP